VSTSSSSMVVWGKNGRPMCFP
ncbi:MAG: hypothetical protein IJ968_07350, partial [Clostridia bacterium]|nr:hypothetical protein [Clostridia bacterium]